MKNITRGKSLKDKLREMPFGEPFFIKNKE